jgi:serine/threonine protein kinase
LEGGGRIASPEVSRYETFDSRLAESFLGEVGFRFRLKHRNIIVGVLGYGFSPVPFIAMEFMFVGSLLWRIGRLNLNWAVEIFLRISWAIDYAQSFCDCS